jgi:hypothetical protein
LDGWLKDIKKDNIIFKKSVVICKKAYEEIHK